MAARLAVAWTLAAALLVAEERPTAESANRLARGGDLGGALAAFDALVAASPDDAGLRAQRALVAYALGRFDAAIADLDRAIDLSPRMLHAWRLRGAADLRAGRAREAAADFEHVLDVAPGDGASYAGRMAARLASGDLAGALGDYKAALTVPEEAEAFRHLLAARVGPLPAPADDLARAERLLEGDLDVVFPVLPDPEGALAALGAAADPAARVRVAVIRGQALEHPSALEGLDKTTQQERVRQARAAYLSAIEADGKDPGGYVAWAESFLRARRLHEEGLDPFDGALDYLGEAQDLIETAIQQCRDSATLRRLLGSVHEAKGNLKEAVAAYEEAIALSPRDRLAYGSLAGFRLRRENAAEKAIKAIDREIAACGEDDEALLARAFCLARLGKKEEAAAALRAILPRVALTHPIAPEGDLPQILRDVGLLPER